MKYLSALLLSSWLRVASAAFKACPLDAQSYPPPTNLSANPSFQTVKKSLDTFLNAHANIDPAEKFSFSVSVFSASEAGLAYQYHHTSPYIKNSTQGTNEITADSIYRIGSISKLLTVYLLLINAGDKAFADAVTQYLPQLEQYAQAVDDRATSLWDGITIGDLAGQMAGLSRDFGLADFSVPNNSLVAIPEAIKKAFPQPPVKDIPTWYLKGIGSEAPIFTTAYTPVYSNEAFSLIGFVIEKITGLSMEAVFNKTYIDNLTLPNTFYTVPETVGPNDIIPGPQSYNNWFSELGAFNPVGGYFSSTNDMATIGKSMLNDKFLSRAVTDRWFKPSSFVENHAQAVGRPWEIFRRPVNGQSVELYCKGGDWGSYHTLFCLSPRYDIGFSVFTSQDPDSNPNASLLEGGFPNQISDILLPAIDNIAKQQAAATFGGRYTSSSTNSSLAVATTSSESGLIVTEWISNGVDVLGFFSELVPDLVYRILPNQLYDGDKVGFTSFYQSTTGPSNGTWYWQCPGWVDVDELTLGNVPLGQMVFDVGANGKASSVGLTALRTTLTRK